MTTPYNTHVATIDVFIRFKLDLAKVPPPFKSMEPFEIVLMKSEQLWAIERLYIFPDVWKFIYNTAHQAYPSASRKCLLMTSFIIALKALTIWRF